MKPTTNRASKAHMTGKSLAVVLYLKKKVKKVNKEIYIILT